MEQRDRPRDLARATDGAPGHHEAPFLISLQRLKDFQRVHSRLPTPHAADPAEATLGDWLHGQIALAREGRLEPLHSMLLDGALGEGWDDGAAPGMRLQQA